MADRQVKARTGMAVASLAVLAVMAACEPCAGTPACHVPPEMSYSGQVIQHSTGAPVGDVVIEFVRRSGPELISDTVRTTSRGDGYFTLRAPAYQDGTVIGTLAVRPPATYPAYTVPRVELRTSRMRGDGGILGRIVVDPFLLMVGELHDRKTGALIIGATVTMRRASGARISPDTVQFITDQDGRFFLQPQVLEFGNGALTADFELDVAGAPRKWLVRQTHKIQYQDGGIRFVLLNAGRALLYVAQAVRRGTGQAVPGTTIEFARTGGIPVSPDTFTSTVNDAGGFLLQPEPLADGEVTFDLTVRPPAPYPTEVIRGLRIASHDDDSTRHMGFFGIGAQVYLRAHFVSRATGEPIRSGTLTAIRRVSGLDILVPLATDSALRAVDSTGTVNYVGPTADSGNVTFDIEVRLPAPAAAEIIRGVQIRARYDSLPNDIGTFPVGPSAAVKRAP